MLIVGDDTNACACYVVLDSNLQLVYHVCHVCHSCHVCAMCVM